MEVFAGVFCGSFSLYSRCLLSSGWFQILLVINHYCLYINRTTTVHQLTMGFTPVDHKWDEALEFYLSSSPCATYVSVAERFEIPVGTLGRAASEEDWPALRKKRQELALLESNAMQMLTEAAQKGTAVPGMAGEVAMVIFAGLLTHLGQMEKATCKPSYAVQVYQNASFCLLNTANACKSLGIVGLPKELAELGKSHGGVDGHGKWDKQLLQQINVTVQGLTAQAQPLAKKAEPVTELPPT